MRREPEMASHTDTDARDFVPSAPLFLQAGPRDCTFTHIN